MPPLIVKTRDKDVTIPPFAYDIAALRALFDAVNRLRVAEGDSPEERERIQEALPKFDNFDVILVRVYAGRPPEWRRTMYVGMYRWDCFRLRICGWDCHVSENWHLIAGIRKWSVYDKRPLINAAQIRWQETVRWMNAVRPYAWHWFEEHQKSTCADGARGRKRDFAAFENDFKE